MLSVIRENPHGCHGESWWMWACFRSSATKIWEERQRWQKTIVYIQAVKYQYILICLQCIRCSYSMPTNVWRRKWKETFVGIFFVKVNECCYEVDHLRRIWRIVAEITHVISVTLIQNNTTLYWWWIRSEITNLSTNNSDKMICFCIIMLPQRNTENSNWFFTTHNFRVSLCMLGLFQNSVK